MKERLIGRDREDSLCMIPNVISSRVYYCQMCYSARSMNMRQPQSSILSAADCLIFCIKLLLLNLNEEGCCRAAGLRPSEYICRTQI